MASLEVCLPRGTQELKGEGTEYHAHEQTISGRRCYSAVRARAVINIILSIVSIPGLGKLGQFSIHNR